MSWEIFPLNIRRVGGKNIFGDGSEESGGAYSTLASYKYDYENSEVSNNINDIKEDYILLTANFGYSKKIFPISEYEFIKGLALNQTKVMPSTNITYTRDIDRTISGYKVLSYSFESSLQRHDGTLRKTKGMGFTLNTNKIGNYYHHESLNISFYESQKIDSMKSLFEKILSTTKISITP